MCVFGRAFSHRLKSSKIDYQNYELIFCTENNIFVLIFQLKKGILD